jgi:hypothetical protein
VSARTTATAALGTAATDAAVAAKATASATATSTIATATTAACNVHTVGTFVSASASASASAIWGHPHCRDCPYPCERLATVVVAPEQLLHSPREPALFSRQEPLVLRQALAAGCRQLVSDAEVGLCELGELRGVPLEFREALTYPGFDAFDRSPGVETRLRD